MKKYYTYKTIEIMQKADEIIYENKLLIKDINEFLRKTSIELTLIESEDILRKVF